MVVDHSVENTLINCEVICGELKAIQIKDCFQIKFCINSAATSLDSGHEDLI